MSDCLENGRLADRSGNAAHRSRGRGDASALQPRRWPFSWFLGSRRPTDNYRLCARDSTAAASLPHSMALRAFSELH